MLDKANDPMTILAPRNRDSQLDPSDLAASSTGHSIAPLSISREIAQTEFVHRTCRATAETAVGAPLGVDGDIQRLTTVSRPSSEGRVSGPNLASMFGDP